MGIDEYAMALHDAINRLPRSWGELLAEPSDGADISAKSAIAKGSEQVEASQRASADVDIPAPSGLALVANI